ncbi:MAG: AAA family ATPase [Saprospiraceae bacterium]|nr:AAA family ATPase [Candidatus Brachybacter algidus]MBK8746361.1 AAA family ATPase [Candidatus Brachybacter algidus]
MSKLDLASKSIGEDRGKDTQNINNTPKLSSIGDLNRLELSEEKISPDAVLEILNDRRVFADKHIEEPKPIFSIGESHTMSLGEFSMIKGKAKSRKTFLITLFISSILAKKEMFGILPEFYIEQPRVIYFDTEQSKYHTQKALKKSLISANCNEHDNVEVYSLRDLDPKSRRDVIATYIDELNVGTDISLVVIDGIKDLVTSINDEAQASMIVSWLLNITTKRNVHVIVVIHENKSPMDKTARGHLGAELTNKAQCVYGVEKYAKDKNISIVSCSEIRGVKEFEPFAFSINEAGLPFIVPVPDNDQSIKIKAISVESFSPDEHKLLAKNIFKNKEIGIGYSYLWPLILEECRKINPNRTPGQSAAKTFIPHWVSTNLIKHDKKYFINLNETNSLIV